MELLMSPLLTNVFLIAILIVLLTKLRSNATADNMRSTLYPCFTPRKLHETSVAATEAWSRHYAATTETEKLETHAIANMKTRVLHGMLEGNIAVLSSKKSIAEVEWEGYELEERLEDAEEIFQEREKLRALYPQAFPKENPGSDLGSASC